jgi:hypothetical protein
MFRQCFLSLVLACASAPAFAQTSPSAPATQSGTPSDEVVVTAVRPAQMREFVRQLAEPGKENQLSRWDGKVCPGVVGARRPAAQALVDRIAARAVSVGLQAGAPGCRANVLVIITPNASTFTPAFVDQNRAFFSYYEDNGDSLGRDALAAFANTARPVRWWHVSQTVTERGQVLGNSAAQGGDGDFSNVQVARLTSASRLRAGTKQEFNRVVVIIDATAIAGKPFSAVADYVAMVSLAQIKAGSASNGSIDSILSLFDAAAPPAAWTDWDKAFVEGLYSAPEFARTARLQENAIVNRVQEAQGAPEAPVAAPPEAALPRP